MALGANVFVAIPRDVSSYGTVNGTSLSCPLTAGAAALILEANPQSTNQQIIGALRETADNAESPNNFIGWGIIDTQRASDFIADGGILPPVGDQLEILQNFPNPFNEATTFQYSLPNSGNVKLNVYNVLGEKVETLVDRNQAAGARTFVWRPENIASGIYVIVIMANGEFSGRKVVYVK